MTDNIIDIEPTLAELAKEKLIDRVCEAHNGSDAERRYIRAYLRCELSDNPNFWHALREKI
tara:strand:- start:68 stop:250 length:183 start_codon:yes stop_codon:yes gene_type:complete